MPDVERSGWLASLVDEARQLDPVEDNDLLWAIAGELRDTAEAVEALALPGLGGVAMRRLNEVKPKL